MRRAANLLLNVHARAAGRAQAGARAPDLGRAVRPHHQVRRGAAERAAAGGERGAAPPQPLAAPAVLARGGGGRGVPAPRRPRLPQGPARVLRRLCWCPPPPVLQLPGGKVYR